MDTVLFCHVRGLIPLLVFYFRVEETFAGGKFRAIPCAVDIYFAEGTFRAKSKFANIANIYFLHAKSTCYTVHAYIPHIKCVF